MWVITVIQLHANVKSTSSSNYSPLQKHPTPNTLLQSDTVDINMIGWDTHPKFLKGSLLGEPTKTTTNHHTVHRVQLTYPSERW